MKHLNLILLLSLGACAQAREAPYAATPAWIKSKIVEFKKLPPFVPPRSIVATTYEGKPVFYISPACCDIPSELYDRAGNLICYPNGGFAGGDGRCTSFMPGREVTTPVWQDSRTGVVPSRVNPTSSGNVAVPR